MLLCFYELSHGNNKLNMDTFILFNHKKHVIAAFYF